MRTARCGRRRCTRWKRNAAATLALVAAAGFTGCQAERREDAERPRVRVVAEEIVAWCERVRRPRCTFTGSRRIGHTRWVVYIGPSDHRLCFAINTEAAEIRGDRPRDWRGIDQVPCLEA